MLKLSLLFIFISDMNSFVYGSSRSRCLKNLKCAGVYVYPGGKLLKLSDDAKCRLESVEGTKIIYFVCGIPDLCTLARDRLTHYEESFIDMDVDEEFIITSYMEKLNRVAHDFKTLGHYVVFATICTMNFEKWNSHRLEKGKTSHLSFDSRYANMQLRLNAILVTLNQRITSLNVENRMATPLIHNYIHQRCTNGKIRYKYTKLVDGVHPSDDIGFKWVEHFAQVIEENGGRLAIS